MPRNGLSYLDNSWICSDLEGNTSERFIDPTNVEVQEHLVSVITEMITKYDFDGVSYDYIRYSETTDYGVYLDSGFSENSINEFNKRYGYSYTDLASELKANVDLSGDWHAFKQDAITNLVGILTKAIRKINPEIIISASPYGYIDDAKSIYMQDIEKWINNGYLDLVLPMLYMESTTLLADSANDYNKYAQRVLQYTGISPLYNYATLRANQELVETVKTENISGVSLFASQNYFVKWQGYAKTIMDVISGSSNKNKAITPTSDPNEVFAAWKNQLFDRYDRIYCDKLSVTERELIISFGKNSEFVMNDPADIQDMLNLLEKLKNDASKLENKAVGDRIVDQVEYIYNIMDAAITRYLVRYGYWDMEKVSERPNVYNLTFEK